MRQKIFFFAVFFLGLFQLLPIAQSYAVVIAPPIKPIPFPIRNTNQTIFGEDQYYTVTFRGNGEAVVTMKAILTNTTDTPIYSINLHLPSNVTATDIAAYQVIAKPQCIQYNETLPTQSSPTTCLQYQQPDYRYVPDDTTYQKIIVQQVNESIQLTLPTPLNANDTGSYLLIYRTFAITHKNIFGAYAFDFSSLKVDDPIHSLQIGITTDSDLYLKGAKATVQYNTSSMAMAALPKAADSGIQNTELNAFYNQIGQGIITKTASSLAPMESYTVTGMYADIGIKLYGKEITLTVLGIVLFIVIIFGIAVFFLKKGTKKAKEESRIHDNVIIFFVASAVSFASVFLAGCYTVGILLLSLSLNTNTYFYEINNMFIFLLISALSGAVYLFFLFVPTIIMTIKKGFIWGGVAFGLTIMWSFIAMIVIFGIAFLFLRNTTQPPVVRPLMMGGSSSGVAIPNKAL